MEQERLRAQEATRIQEMEQPQQYFFYRRRHGKFAHYDSDDDSDDEAPEDPPATILQPDLQKEEPCQPEEEVRSTLIQPESSGDAELHQFEIPFS